MRRERRMDRHDEANSRIFAVLWTRRKNRQYVFSVVTLLFSKQNGKFRSSTHFRLCSALKYCLLKIFSTTNDISFPGKNDLVFSYYVHILLDDNISEDIFCCCLFYSKLVALIIENYKVQKYAKQWRFLCSWFFRLTVSKVSAWYHQHVYYSVFCTLCMHINLYIESIHSALIYV